MFGYGRGWHRGRGFWRTNIESPEGYTYIGPVDVDLVQMLIIRKKEQGE